MAMPSKLLSRSLRSSSFSSSHPKWKSTPWPGGFKCFTCEDVKDNYECNRWSADVFCPRETSYCFTNHRMDKDGESLSVTKRCVSSSVCQSVGCCQLDQNGARECTACCEGNICNISVPHNASDAGFATIMLHSSAWGLRKSWSLLRLLVLIIILLCCISVC
uniref:ly6/PLAUR domain-containing protein 6 isoform X2 n=1 Tax=Myxine glutinosa TaxID=7769 RepID=UPI00358DE664